MPDSINTQMVNDLKELMEDDFSILLETFISDANARLEDLQSAITNNDAEQLKQVAHAFKGSSANLGASKLSEICFSLENLGRESKLENAPAIYAELATEYHAVREYFTSLL
ncbi:MAG: Hpt domain-containing protein [Enterobacterales bacterium]|nr:Hpt domain-containing protein [Enterobacterales bacterium]